MYIMRLVNLHEHRAWLSMWSSFDVMMLHYGSPSYQDRAWQAEVWHVVEDSETPYNRGVIATMRRGRWRLSPQGEMHFTDSGRDWPTLPRDINGGR